MIVAAALCPHPPLLVPQVAGRASPEMDDCRTACAAALADLGAAGPDLLVVVGGGTGTRLHPSGSRGSLRPYGVHLDVTLGPPPSLPGPTTLPLSLTIGAWLLHEAAWAAPVEGLQVDEHAGAERCLAAGRSLRDRAPRTAVLVMADLSARRAPTAPGYFDTRSVPLDTAVESALLAGDSEAVAGIDVSLAEQVLLAGRAPLQVLAGAGFPGSVRQRWTGDPYGVRYVVASWGLSR
jgi:hypothetical protein